MRTYLRAVCIVAEAARASIHLKARGCSRPVAGALLVVVCLVGCAPPPPAPLAGPDPANPNAGTPRTEYRSTVGPYTSLRPTAPAPPGDGAEKTPSAPKASP
jgi:hypothetical protein